VTADGKLDIITEKTDVGEQRHDSCSISAATRVRRAIATKKRQFKRGALATPLGRSAAAAALTRLTRRCLSTCGHRNTHIIWILQQDSSKFKELYQRE